MNATRLLALTAIGLVALGVGAIPSNCLAQGGTLQTGSPGTVVISIYHVAPGKHIDFLRFVAEGR